VRGGVCDMMDREEKKEEGGGGGGWEFCERGPSVKAADASRLSI